MKKISAMVTGILLSAYAVQAATLYVDINNTTPTSPYSSWGTAATSIQAAVDTASADDTVRVADGTYAITNTITINKAITVESENGPDAVFVDGGGSNRVFTLGKVDCTLRGLTITNGFGGSWGGGVYCPTVSWDIHDMDRQIVTNCVLSGNDGTQGGGMYRGVAKNCRFENNTGVSGAGANDTLATDCDFISNGDYIGGGAYNGGGMFGGVAIRCVFSNNYLTVGAGMAGGEAIDCVFVDNTAWYGGGKNSGTAVGCVFSNNYATYNGGGMQGGSASDCTFVANNAGWSGGGSYETTAIDCLFQENVTVGSGGTSKNGGGMFRGRATDCVFIGNTAPSYGGGFYTDLAGVSIESCTFTSNSAVGGGGAAVKSDTILNNCVFDHNTATGGGGLHRGNANNCTFTENAATGNAGGGMYYGTANNCISWNNTALSNVNFSIHTTTNSCWTEDPLFVDAANGDFHLLENSLCIDGGSNALASALTRDRDGNDRIQNGTVDYGAYEFVPPILTTNTLNVLSTYGSPTPAVGAHEYSYGTIVTCSVSSVTSGLTNYSPTGWTLIGQDPASGTAGTFALTSETNAVLTWNWQTNYWLEISTSGNGSIDAPDGFYAKDSVQTLTATPDAGWLFMGWNGDASGTNEAILTMAEPKVVMATFSDDADNDGLTNTEEEGYGSNPWKSDTDGDGFGDKLEVDHNWNPTVSDQWAVDYIGANGTDFGLYSSNAVLDVAVGQVALGIEGATARLRLQMEKSDDLVTWTNAGDAVEWTMNVDGDKKFLRVRSAPSE